MLELHGRGNGSNDDSRYSCHEMMFLGLCDNHNRLNDYDLQTRGALRQIDGQRVYLQAPPMTEMPSGRVLDMWQRVFSYLYGVRLLLSDTNYSLLAQIY